MKAMPLHLIARCVGRMTLLLSLLCAGSGFTQIVYPTPSPPPPVRITSPANHATFFAPVDIPTFAYVSLPISAGATTPTFDSITNVEFYANGMDLGRGLNLGLIRANPTPVYGNFVSATPISPLGHTYCFVWTNVPPGAYALTAVAKGDYLSRTSPPVNIRVLVCPTNPTPLDVVSVTATDPVAIAGTNAWVWRGLTNDLPAWTNWTTTPLQWCTNWGPKNALFTVKRIGDVSSALTVNYSLGGTASNGVDYAALPGYATIPAGASDTLIPVVPIDNGVPNLIKTVLLRLTPSTNKPSAYAVGFPPCAEAIILENWLRPPPAVLPDGSFHLVATGPDGAWFYVEYTTDFLNWSPVCTNQVVQGSIDFVDPDAPNNSTRFYRPVPMTGAP
jgi:hypothetical protein